LFPQAAANACAVKIFNFIPVEVGGDVRNHSPGDKKIVPGEHNLGHDVAIIAIIFEVVFGSKIVKAVCFWQIFAKRQVAVFANGGITILDKFKTDLPA